jgi:DNA invertase Pin-like site-specific DNA recombinase
MIKERQREGIAKAKERGVYKGRKATVDAEAIRKELALGTSVRKTAEKLKVAASTVQRVKKEAY